MPMLQDTPRRQPERIVLVGAFRRRLVGKRENARLTVGKPITFDAFWIERGGKADPSGGYVLPLRDYQARLKSVQTPRLIDFHRAALSEQAQAKIASG